MGSFQLLSLFLLISNSWCQDEAPVPVVLWHGMGDSAAGMIGIAVGLFFEKYLLVYRVFQNILKENIPDVYVHRIMIGGNLIVDTESGFFRDTNRQVRSVIINAGRNRG